MNNKPDNKKIAIVGFGCAGYHAVKAIREYDPRCIIDVYSNTSEAPYNPMLTTYFASDKIPETQMYPLGTLEEIKDKFKLNIFTSTAVKKINAVKREIVTSDGVRGGYSDIIIASGARAVIPPIKNLPKRRIYTMRTADDARALRVVADTGIKSALVVGAQMVGIKVVELLRRRGVDVLLADMAAHMFPASAYETTAAVISDRLERAGVRLKFGAAVVAVNGDGERLCAEFSDGEKYSFDAIVFCSGIKPNIDFIDREEIEVGYAIKVGEDMQTSVPHIYAVGDCCETKNVLGNGNAYIGLWANSAKQGKVAGSNVAGRHEKYDGNLIHNITHYMDTDFISVGDVKAPGERVFWEGPGGGWRMEATVCDGRIRALNILDNANIAGPVKNILLHQAARPDAGMTEAGNLILARSGMPADIIRKLGGA